MLNQIKQHLLPINQSAKRCLDRRMNRFAKNVYSQNGEDGIISELFRRLSIDHGWVVEFGAWDGKHFSNTFNLISDNPSFRAVYIEGDESRFQDLLATTKSLEDRVIPILAYVTPLGTNSLQVLLDKTHIPLDFELLSIDVDGTDYLIWEGLEKYTPKVVVIEINSGIPPHMEYVHGQGDDQGSSFRSTLLLGTQKKYTLICHTGNMIFVRDDLLSQVNIPHYFLDNPTALFSDTWIRNK